MNETMYALWNIPTSNKISRLTYLEQKSGPALLKEKNKFENSDKQNYTFCRSKTE